MWISIVTHCPIALLCLNASIWDALHVLRNVPIIIFKFMSCNYLHCGWNQTNVIVIGITVYPFSFITNKTHISAFCEIDRTKVLLNYLNFLISFLVDHILSQFEFSDRKSVV